MIRFIAAITVLAFQAAQPTFEVASVKRNTSGASSASFGSRPGGNLVVVNNSLRNIIRNTWNLQNYQIVGGPDWINNDRWDITAKAPEGALQTFAEMMLMMRALLADRFKLVFTMKCAKPRFTRSF